MKEKFKERLKTQNEQFASEKKNNVSNVNKKKKREN